jgi:D-ribose pyranose/furanose isomerase RbsD
MVMEYRNIDEKTVSDALFEIPSGYQKMSMPMMPGMPGQ